jgi:hypothetical protein
MKALSKVPKQRLLMKRSRFNHVDFANTDSNHGGSNPVFITFAVTIARWKNGSTREKKKHRRRIVVFDCRTGEEVTARLTRPLFECAELETLNPILSDAT